MELFLGFFCLLRELIWLEDPREVEEKRRASLFVELLE